MSSDRDTIPMTKETFKAYLGEGFHTALRKGVEGAHEAWTSIAKMPEADWEAVLDYVAWGFEMSYRFEEAEEED